eukprot:1156183-Pelagomonas_calceolata.AAC.13
MGMRVPSLLGTNTWGAQCTPLLGDVHGDAPCTGAAQEYLWISCCAWAKRFEQVGAEDQQGICFTAPALSRSLLGCGAP